MYGLNRLRKKAGFSLFEKEGLTGAKALIFFCCSYGTTEVVPCYKTWLHRSFPQPVKALVILRQLRQDESRAVSRHRIAQGVHIGYQ
jgi:hypothetical protein